MNRKLNNDLQRHSKLAFQRIKPGAKLIQNFHRLPKKLQQDLSYQRVYDWLLVPFSLWPVDILGIADHLMKANRTGSVVDGEIKALIKNLGDAPNAKTCESICLHEHQVKGGSYESLIKAQHKFDAKETALIRDLEFKKDWKWIKEQFDIADYQAKNGVIRRRMVSERNFHARDWNFSWKSVEDKFRNVFDAFCHKWTLYGMERDKPLLQKLSVNVTPYGTMIVIPRYWSFDYNRDLKWKAVTRLHHSRGVSRQGAKLDANLVERRIQAQKARIYLSEAQRKGMKGDSRDRWVMGKIGLHPETDPKQLRRILKTL